MANLTPQEKEANYQLWRETRAYNQELKNLSPAKRMRTFCASNGSIRKYNTLKPRKPHKSMPWDWDLTEEQKSVAHPYLAFLLKKWQAYGPLPRWRYAAIIAQVKSYAKHGHPLKPGDRTWELRYSILDKMAIAQTKEELIKSKRELSTGSPTPLKLNTMPEGGRLEGI